MCGRYTLRRAAMIAAAMQAMIDTPELDDIYLTPAQYVPIVRLEGAARVIDFAQWGFIPSWAGGNAKVKPINAKSETVATSGMFRSAFKSSRCLLPADGFFEPKGPKGMKHRPQFYFQRPDRGIFAFAGLWSHRDNSNTCTLLTITPNAVVGPIHNRMPVILSPANYAKWLDPTTAPEELQAMLQPDPDGDLVVEPESRPVSGEQGLFD